MDYQTLLDRRAEIADEISETITRLGSLMRQEVELRDQLRRIAERDGAKTNPFENAVSIADAICGELTRAGLVPHRADSRLRLRALVEGQHERYLRQADVRKQVRSPSAA